MGGSHQLQVIITGLSVPMGLAFEAGYLYITNSNTVPPTAINNTVSVFPERNGTLFGVPSHEARPDHGILGSEYSHGFGL